MKKILLAALCIALCAAALAGCGKASTFELNILDETGAIQVAAENADANASAVSSLAIAEGEVLLISPDLQKGSVKVELLESENAAEAVFEETVDGRILDVYDVAPGEYAVRVSNASGGTTGTVVINNVSKDEFDQQNADLAEELEKNGVELSSEDSEALLKK